jgi:hypothetical protein
MFNNKYESNPDYVTRDKRGCTNTENAIFLLISKDVALNRFQHKRKEDFVVLGLHRLGFCHVPLYNKATSVIHDVNTTQ